ncbi:hypothetical protein [Polymorphospora rubra]|uniref:hypothetical protein n=1 Tax=Polymorphospora rubra TaxID=338584 RepID=UPI003401202A
MRDQAGAHGHFSANSHRYDSERDALSSATCFIDLRPLPGQASVEAPGLSLSHRLPTLVVWLPSGLRGSSRAGAGREDAPILSPLKAAAGELDRKVFDEAVERRQRGHQHLLQAHHDGG